MKTINIHDAHSVDVYWNDGRFRLTFYARNHKIVFHLTPQWIMMLASRMWDAARSLRIELTNAENALTKGGH